MATGTDITPEKAVKMRAWLARHESDKKGEGYEPGEPGFPSAGRLAWALWGGDPAVPWSNKIVRQMEKADEDAKKSNNIEIEGKEIIQKVWTRYIEKQFEPTERKLQRAANRYLREAAARYVARFREQVQQRKFDPKTRAIIVDWSSFTAYALEKAQVIKVIGSVGKEQFVEAGITELKRIFRIARLDAFDFIGSWSEYGELLEQYTTLYIDEMSDEIAKTNAREMQKLVADGLNEGLSIDDISRKIETSTGFNAKRGTLIARTEATRSHGNASLQSIKDSNSYGVKTKKSWIGNTDQYTRPSHLGLIRDYSKKEDAIDVNDYFVINSGPNRGSKSLTPGGFREAAEVCNCRCAIRPVVIRDPKSYL